MRKQTTALLLMLACTLSTHAQLVPKDAVPEKVADGYKFTEGPALGPDGCIYFTDIPASLILKFDPETKETTTFRENTERTNGLMWFNGDLYACSHGARAVRLYPVNPNHNKPDPENKSLFREEIDPTQPLVVISEWRIKRQIKDDDGQLHHDDQIIRFNSPNDLAIDTGGNLYFTDPRYGNREDMETDIEGVYFLSGEPLKVDFDVLIYPPRKRIDADLVRPNGIVLSPDEKILYVADHGANWIYAYDIESPGKVKNKRRFAQLNGGQGRGSDGMCVDSRGRLYATGHGRVFEPTGQPVATIAVGKQTTNCTFGADGKTLYITANKGLYRITLDTDAPLEHADQKED